MSRNTIAVLRGISLDEAIGFCGRFIVSPDCNTGVIARTKARIMVKRSALLTSRLVRLNTP